MYLMLILFYFLGVCVMSKVRKIINFYLIVYILMGYVKWQYFYHFNLEILLKRLSSKGENTWGF